VSVPVDLGRDEARELAEEELRSPIYDAAEPTLLERVGRWIGERLDELIQSVGALGPGGYGGLLLLVAVVVVGAVVVRLVVGRVGRDAGGPAGAVLGGAVRSAAEHRRAADEHARRGEWAAAVQERMRAVVRGLEERDLIAPAAGRTAPEIAAEAGRLLPERAAELRIAAAAFDGVVFGGRPAGPEDDARLRTLDEALGRTRPQLVP
jgi:hypothetical protein